MEKNTQCSIDIQNPLRKKRKQQLVIKQDSQEFSFIDNHYRQADVFTENSRLSRQRKRKQELKIKVDSSVCTIETGINKSMQPRLKSRKQQFNVKSDHSTFPEVNKVTEIDLTRLPTITDISILQNNQVQIVRAPYQKRCDSSTPVLLSAQPDNSLDESVILEHYLGPMNILCIHCKAKHFESEKVWHKGKSFNDCCSHGKVKLDPLPELPLVLKELFTGAHPLSKHFYDNIRLYNSSFSVASFNANLVAFRNRRPGPFCFKIQGQIYYQINTSLYPANNDIPRNGQLFIVDSNEAVDYRLSTHRSLNREVLEAIDNIMRQHNVFAQSFQMMKDELDTMTIENNGIEPELELRFSLKKGLDRRRYNFQRVNEVAAVFSTTADGELPESYVTIRNKHTKELQYVSSMNENVEAWTYSLYYPYGTKGWHDGIRMENSVRRVTRNAYIKNQMAIREDHNNYIIMGRRLFQQWTVDNYVKMERDRMTVLRNNQKQMRADSYQGLLDHLQNRANDTNSQIGKVIILPSSYQGSPRNMLQTYQDAMAIVRKFGKPDLFITMTSNHKWKEITENLLDGQTASDRPDLVARVFENKKKELLNLIKDKKIFGEVQAYVYVIEYQKRGLPHVHLLLTLRQNSKITTPAIVDKFISAEIPDPNKYPRLYEIVKKNMVHGPCGDWCLNEKEKCSKHYPKENTNETILDENGYPVYRRRDNGTHTRQDGFRFNNKHVVPHNRILLLTLNCHINVEVVSNIKAKSCSCTIADTSTKSADLMIEDINNDDAIRSALGKESMLIAYFNLNEHDPQARHLTCSVCIQKISSCPEEIEFAKYLLTVGDGTASNNDSDLSLPEYCIAPRDADIAEDIYGEVIRNKEYDKLANWAILSARNVDVDDISIRVVELLDKSTEKIYTSMNSVKNCDNGEIREALLPEYLETLNPPNLPPHELRLRQNTVVMLIRNLSINKGLCNGTRLQILDCSNHLLRLMTRIRLSLEDDSFQLN
ncbi:uncharacterized protein LOC122856401 [Aphidius gifuensis]|uniref:uncharacterized protein LOC122856401 n=1 Tax=Aphidius gifuensis TaxID=684658 RepID=UPI001CDC9A32|nr:uncharacterized protein LOC122856401 [Aphidius gifuensis]